MRECVCVLNRGWMMEEKEKIRKHEQLCHITKAEFLVGVYLDLQV